MKVGVYLGDSLPQLGGGYTFEEEVCQSLVRHASESPHEFVLVTAGESDHLSAWAGSLEVISVRRSLYRRISNRFSYESQKVLQRVSSAHRARLVAKDAERSLARHGVELVWSLNFFTPVLDLPFITTIWDLQHRLQPVFPEVSTNGVWEARERHFSSTLRRAAAVICGTEAGRSEIERFYQVPSERIWKLPHPTPRFALGASASNTNDVRKKYDLPEEFLFYPAQFWPHKNHITILRALRILREEHGASLVVVFVGSDRGNLGHICEMARQYSLTDSVRFLGFVSREDLVALYRSAFALVYPTYFGPENLPPLEAFALNCPVIASAVAGSEEQLGDAALLFNPKNPVELATAVLHLKSDPSLRAELIDRGYQRASRFTGSDFVLGMFKLLDQLESIRLCWPSQLYIHR